jgi:hypothetical protein
MTRGSIAEYAAALRGRYLKANRAGKRMILDEFCSTTGYHRKAAIRLLRHPPKVSRGRRGRKKTYGPDVAQALSVAWEATDHICSKRLVPFLPELVPVLERHGELRLSSPLRALVLSVSPATADRLLAPYRRQGLRRPYTTSHSPSALKAMIPIRTFSDWEGVRVGYVEADLVAHCGDSTEGFYLTTLVAVDIVTGWTECVPVWGKGQSRVGGGVHRIQRQLPFPLRGLDCDNGGEFINHGLWDYCRRHGIEFTRSRSYKKNDQAYVEQKNGSVVRRLVGYDRYATREAYDQLDRLYQLVRVHMNFFQPLCKLTHKERVGAKVRKYYDRAQTPYQRLVSTGELDEAQRQSLAELYQGLNPLQLQREIWSTLEQLWPMATPNVTTQAIVAARAKLGTARRERKPHGQVRRSQHQ